MGVFLHDRFKRVLDYRVAKFADLIFRSLVWNDFFVQKVKGQGHVAKMGVGVHRLLPWILSTFRYAVVTYCQQQ